MCILIEDMGIIWNGMLLDSSLRISELFVCNESVVGITVLLVLTYNTDELPF